MAETAERLTALCWILLAAAGILVRLRRLAILYSFHCADPWDIRYHKSVIRSSWLRLTTKCVFLMGGILAWRIDPVVPLYPNQVWFWAWRGGIIIILLVLLTEDINVDRMRRELGTLKSGRWKSRP